MSGGALFETPAPGVGRADAKITAQARDRIIAHDANLRRASEIVDQKMLAVASAEDVMDAAKSITRLVLALKDLQQYAEEVEGVARAALGDAMMESGCTQARIESHVSSVSEAQPTVEIDDPAAVPEAFMNKPKPPGPDRRKILAALKRGDRIPGCRILPSNGAPVVRIQAIEREVS